MTVYLIRHIASNRVYVGATVASLKKRFAQHIWKAHRGLSSLGSLQGAMARDGMSAFRLEILYFASSVTDLFEAEAKFVYMYRSNEPEFGFNLTPAGQRGRPRAEDFPCAKCRKRPRLESGSYCEVCKFIANRRYRNFQLFKRNYFKSEETVNQ